MDSRTQDAYIATSTPSLVEHLFRMLLDQATGMGPTPRSHFVPVRGALAAWQEARAKALIDEHLVDGIPLVRLAAACRLSTSAFARGFRISAGISPHEWLLRRRVHRAVALMGDTRLALADVALADGFSDQSHFTRAFGKRVGMTPGAWRRNLAGAGDAHGT